MPESLEQPNQVFSFPGNDWIMNKSINIYTRCTSCRKLQSWKIHYALRKWYSSPYSNNNVFITSCHELQIYVAWINLFLKNAKGHMLAEVFEMVQFINIAQKQDLLSTHVQINFGFNPMVNTKS